MGDDMDGSEFKPADYTTFEKVQQLLALAEVNKDVGKLLMSDKATEIRQAFAMVGLGRNEVDQAITLVDEHFGTDIRAAVSVRPW